MSATEVPAGTLRVEAVYALPGGVHSRTLQLPAGSLVADAVVAFLREVGEGLEHDGVGIFGRRCEPSKPLHDGDRVEFYRPLTTDPKAQRRIRAKILRKRS